MNNSRLKLVWPAVKAIRLKAPKRSKIIVLDHMNLNLLEEIILREINFEVLPRFMDLIYISPSIVLYMIKNLGIETVKRIYRRQPVSFQKIYFKSCIEYMKPAAAITFIDNNPVFQILAGELPGVDFYYVINGARGVEYFRLGNKMNFSNLFGWGQYYHDLFIEHGHTIGKFYPSGPLIGNYYKGEVSINPAKEFDICLISQYRSGIMNGSTLPYIKNVLLTLDKYLASYLQQNNHSFCIAACSHQSSDYEQETEYFRSQYGEKVHIIPNNRKDFSTYRAMDSSDVVVTFRSTAAYEAYSWGKKVLFCNLLGDTRYESDLLDDFSVGTGGYEEFEKKLNGLLAMPQESYFELTRENRDYIVPYNPEGLAHNCIRNALQNSIQEAEARNKKCLD